jgi:hypothetical protein
MQFDADPTPPERHSLLPTGKFVRGPRNLTRDEITLGIHDPTPGEHRYYAVQRGDIYITNAEERQPRIHVAYVSGDTTRYAIRSYPGVEVRDGADWHAFKGGFPVIIHPRTEPTSTPPKTREELRQLVTELHALDGGEA